MGSTHRHAAIIFDMDGLMVDTEPLYWEVARAMGGARGRVVSDEALRQMMGRGRLDAMRLFAQAAGIEDASAEELLAERETLLMQRYRAGIEPMPGLEQTLARFHGRFKLAVATSAPRKFAEIVLPAVGAEGLMEVVQTGDDIVHAKPDPEIYLRTAERLHLPPHRCIVLEDSHAGAMAAHRAGARVIAVPTPLTAGEDFSFADDVVTSLEEAADRIEGLAQKY